MSVCLKCFNHYKTSCCETETGVSLTLHDVKKIAEATGKKPQEFAEIRDVQKEIYREFKNDPIFKNLLMGKKLLQLKDHDGICFFLSDKGCKIFEHRPALCRMHPFEFSDSTHHSNEIGFKLSKDDKFEEEECLLCQNHFHSDDHKSAAEEMGEEYYDFLKFMEAYYYRILYFDSVKHEIKTMADVERIIKRPDFGKEIHILKEKHGKRAKK